MHTASSIADRLLSVSGEQIQDTLRRALQGLVARRHPGGRQALLAEIERHLDPQRAAIVDESKVAALDTAIRSVGEAMASAEPHSEPAENPVTSR